MFQGILNYYPDKCLTLNSKHKLCQTLHITSPLSKLEAFSIKESLAQTPLVFFLLSSHLSSSYIRMAWRNGSGALVSDLPFQIWSLTLISSCQLIKSPFWPETLQNKKCRVKSKWAWPQTEFILMLLQTWNIVHILVEIAREKSVISRACREND